MCTLIILSTAAKTNPIRIFFNNYFHSIMFRLTLKETGRQQCLSPNGRQGKRLIHCWNRSVHFHCSKLCLIQEKGYFPFYKRNAQTMNVIHTNLSKVHSTCMYIFYLNIIRCNLINRTMSTFQDLY